MKEEIAFKFYSADSVRWRQIGWKSQEGTIRDTSHNRTSEAPDFRAHISLQYFDITFGMYMGKEFDRRRNELP
jgi:hypothetical protein